MTLSAKIESEGVNGCLQPGRLWSWLEMIEAKIGELFDAYRNFVVVTEGIRTRPEGKSVALTTAQFTKLDENLGLMRRACEEHALQMTSRSARRLGTMIETIRPAIAISQTYVLSDSNATDLREAMVELLVRFSDELDTRRFFEIHPRYTEYFSPIEPLFGYEVHGAFPSSRDEIEEAGKCLALERYTACVMHLMRALEPAKTALAADLGVPDLDVNWQAAIKKIEEARLQKRAATDKATWKFEDEPFYAAAIGYFRDIKNAWRNPSMHATRSYTAKESEDIYRAVRAFMIHLSERLSEPEEQSS